MTESNKTYDTDQYKISPNGFTDFDIFSVISLSNITYKEI